MPNLTKDDLIRLPVVRPVASAEEMEQELRKLLDKGVIQYRGQEVELRQPDRITTTVGELVKAYELAKEGVVRANRGLATDHLVVADSHGTTLAGPLPIVPVMLRSNITGAASDGFLADVAIRLPSMDANKVARLHEPGFVQVHKKFLRPVARDPFIEVRGDREQVRWEGRRPWLEFFKDCNFVVSLVRAIYLVLPNGFRRTDDRPYSVAVGYHHCLLRDDIAYRCGKAETQTAGVAELLDLLMQLDENRTGSLRQLLRDRFQLEVDPSRSCVRFDHPPIGHQQARWLKLAAEWRRGSSHNQEPLSVNERTPIWTQTGAYAYRGVPSGKEYPHLELCLETYFRFVSLLFLPGRA